MGIAALHPSYGLSAVIARLDRAIQYAGTAVIAPRSRGVLDTRFRGYDSGSSANKPWPPGPRSLYWTL